MGVSNRWGGTFFEQDQDKEGVPNTTPEDAMYVARELGGLNGKLLRVINMKSQSGDSKDLYPFEEAWKILDYTSKLVIKEAGLSTVAQSKNVTEEAKDVAEKIENTANEASPSFGMK